MTRAQLTDEEWEFIEPHLPIGEYGIVMSSALHGMAAFIASCMLPPEGALAGVDTLVHHLLHGMKPR
ncbi:hypothetical protein [Streptomyces sp. LBL]|uniref:hypothetical protein n=1 Tax=Streptomyces sp. LBL TaxID=2940562 RepID=UPI0024765025|nr:hypothetical protein [Streptomyces sp. LBL]